MFILSSEMTVNFYKNSFFGVTVGHPIDRSHAAHKKLNLLCEINFLRNFLKLKTRPPLRHGTPVHGGHSKHLGSVWQDVHVGGEAELDGDAERGGGQDHRGGLRVADDARRVLEARPAAIRRSVPQCGIPAR